MAGARFNILFAGELMENADPFEVRRRIQRRFKLSDEAIARLFGNGVVAVKRNVDTATASRYRKTFRDAGALVRIEPVASPTRNPSPISFGLASTPANDSSAGPSRSASSSPPLQIAPREEGPLERSPVGEARQIDTSHLSLVTDPDWTLEDCQPSAQATALPDTSHLEILDPGSYPDSKNRS
jgi:hypothetical protein